MALDPPLVTLRVPVLPAAPLQIDLCQAHGTGPLNAAIQQKKGPTSKRSAP
jgi:hypothetical protein